MNRKHNPLLSLAALLLLATILVWICAGCTEAAAETTEAPARFTSEYMGYFNPTHLYIITDTETGMQYLLAQLYGQGVGITPLLPGEVDYGAK